MPTVLDATVVNQAYDTSGNGGRKLVRLENGWLVAGAKTGSGTSQIVYLYKSTDNGQTWSELCYIQHGSGSSQIDFSFATKGNTLYILSPNLDSNVFFYKVDVENQTNENIYPNRITIDSGQNTMGNGSLTINEDGTELHAAWSSKNSTYPNSFNIRYVKGTINADGSVTWGAVEQVTIGNTSGYDTKNPSVMVKDNQPIIITESKYNIVAGNGIQTVPSITVYKRDNSLYSHSGYVNSSWSTKAVYAGGASYAQSSPSACVAPNGRIWVAWQGKDSTDYVVDNVRVSYSDDGGVTWSSMQKLTSGNANNQGAVSITVNKNNKVFILFADGTGGTGYDISVISNDGTGWSTKSTIASGTGNQQAPSALYDLTLDFTSPLFIYQNVGSSKVGFYGTWTVTTISVTPGYIGQKTSTDESNILTYSITTDGTMSTITEKINGVTIATRTNPTSGQQFTVSLTQEQWDAIKYGNGHTLTIEMGDYIWTYTFDKRLNANDDILSVVKGAQDLETHLNGIKAQLAEAIRANGGTVNDTDAWSAFVSAIANMQSKRWASGTGVTSSTSMVFTFANGTGSSQYPLEVTGLSFRPSIVLIYSTIDSNYVTVLFPENLYTNNSNPIRILLLPYSTVSTSTGTGYSFRLEGNAYVSDGAFRLPYQSADRTVNWIAFE